MNDIDLPTGRGRERNVIQEGGGLQGWRNARTALCSPHALPHGGTVARFLCKSCTTHEWTPECHDTLVQLSRSYCILPGHCKCRYRSAVVHVPLTCKCSYRSAVAHVPLTCKCNYRSAVVHVPLTCKCSYRSAVAHVPLTCKCNYRSAVVHVPLTCKCNNRSAVVHVPLTCKCNSGRQFCMCH